MGNQTDSAVITKGTHFLLDKKRCKVLEMVKDKFVVEDEYGEDSLISRDTMRDYLISNRIDFDIEDTIAPMFIVSDINKAEEVMLLNAHLVALDAEQFPKSEKTRLRVIDQVGNDRGIPVKDRISQSTLRDKYTRWYEANKNTAKLFAKQSRNKGPTHNQKMIDLIDEVLDEEYLILGGASAAECLRIIEKRHENRGIPGECIKRSQFYDGYVNRIDPYEMRLIRQGRDAARAWAKESGEVIHADYPLQVVEMDALHLSVGIIDEKTQEFLGTLIIYIAIDRCSRYVLGYSMSIKSKGSEGNPGKGEKSESVLELIHHVVNKKKPSVKAIHKWLDCVVPELFLGDAGAAFNNLFVKLAIAQLNTSVKTCEAGDPIKKPFIERINDSIRERFAIALPGYRKKRYQNINYKGSVEADACLYLHEAKEQFEKYILDHYHQSEHRGLHLESPEQCYVRMTKDQIEKPMPDLTMFNMLKGKQMTGKLQAGHGIQLNGFHYMDKRSQNGRMLDLFGWLEKKNNLKGNPEVQFFYDEDDISSIIVVNLKDNTLMRVPCTDTSIIKGTSLHQAKATKADIGKGEKPTSFKEGNEDIDKIKKRQARLAKEKREKKSGTTTPKAEKAAEQTEQDALDMVNRQNSKMPQNYQEFTHDDDQGIEAQDTTSVNNSDTNQHDNNSDEESDWDDLDEYEVDE